MAGSYTILLIDDNHHDREYYAQRLRTSLPDSVVIQTTTGRAGLAICNSRTIDCVVLELGLPDMSGFEVLAYLVWSASHPQVAVVVLTHLSNPYLLELALKNGAKAAVQKATPGGDLLETLILNSIASVNRDRELLGVQKKMESVSPAITVLLIDSKKEDRQYWSQRLNLSSPDYVVFEADTGAAGLTICQSQRVDCVVTELALSDMSGFEVLVELVPIARSPRIAVVMLTSQLFTSMSQLALSNGAQAYLIKCRSSGDDLDKAIHKAIAVVGPHKERHS